MASFEVVMHCGHLNDGGGKNFQFSRIFQKEKQLQPFSKSPNFYSDKRKPYYIENNTKKKAQKSPLTMRSSNINQFVYLKLFFNVSKLELPVHKVTTVCLVND